MVACMIKVPGGGLPDLMTVICGRTLYFGWPKIMNVKEKVRRIKLGSLRDENVKPNCGGE